MNTKYTNLALLVLRVGIAITFFRNGWEALEHTQEMIYRVANSGVSPFAPETLLTLIGIWDMAIGALLVIGLWTKKVAVPATLWLVVVILVLAKTNGAEDVFDRLPYLAGAISLIMLGGGAWEISNLRRRI